MGESATNRDDDAIAGEVPSTPADEVFELRPPPPIRALGIAAITAVAGAVLMTVSRHPVPIVLGAILLGLAVLLTAAAVALSRRLRCTIRMDSSALSVTRGSRTGQLAWTDISKVAERGHQLIAVALAGHRDLVIAVPGPHGRTYDALLMSLKTRLDDSRGYSDFSG